MDDLFTLSTVSALTSVNAQTLKTWLAKPWGHGKIKGGKGAGNKRLFTWENVAELSVVAEANRLFGTRDMPGLFEAARFYAYASGGGDAYGLPDRLPGLPYDYAHGNTWVALASNGYFDVCDAPNGDPKNVIQEMQAHLATTAFLVINMSTVFNRQCSVLGKAPRKLLTQKYGVDRI